MTICFGRFDSEICNMKKPILINIGLNSFICPQNYGPGFIMYFFQLFVFGFLVIIIPTCCALPKPQVQKNGHMLPVEIDEARETKKQEVNYETKRDADLHESVNGGNISH